MPLNQAKLEHNLRAWTTKRHKSKFESADSFIVAYTEYAIEGTFGVNPLINPAAKETAKLMMKGVLYTSFMANNRIPWVIGISTALVLYWNTVVSLAGYGPNIIPPVVAEPSSLNTSLISVLSAGDLGASSDTIASLMTTSLDTWTRTVTANNISTGSPVPVPVV